jgi:hypothetical protein
VRETDRFARIRTNPATRADLEALRAALIDELALTILGDNMIGFDGRLSNAGQARCPINVVVS